MIEARPAATGVAGGPAGRLALRPGVIDTGLFLGMATAVVIAGSGGVQVRLREDAR